MSWIKRLWEKVLCRILGHEWHERTDDMPFMPIPGTRICERCYKMEFANRVYVPPNDAKITWSGNLYYNDWRAQSILTYDGKPFYEEDEQDEETET